jgi:hypothetical protein
MQNTTSSPPQGVETVRPIDHIRALAVHLRQARDDIHALSQAIDDERPVEPRYGEDSLTGEELREDLIAWDYELRRAEDVLESHFTTDMQQALRAAGLNDKDDEEEDSDEDAGPSEADVIETRRQFGLPPALYDPDLPRKRDMEAAPDQGRPALAQADAELPPARTRPYWLS